MIKNFLFIFFISMLPLIELRGAIPVSQALQLPVVPAYIVCIIANMIPVPFIYLFARKFLEWGKDKPAIGGICRFFLVKGSAAGEKLQRKAGKGIFAALMLFVGIPLPGTGAWTGTLAASFLGIKFRETVAAVLLGIIMAGCIMMAVSFGAFGAIGAFVGK
ncbi:COG2426 family protein [Treponema sp.]|uniref:COG2426 family protein n=1 Tax=Treponema sp. TaxID=166 RepID=UPI003F1042E6